MAEAEQVAKSFVDFYYQTFDRNRADLVPLYVRGDIPDDLYSKITPNTERR